MHDIARRNVGRLVSAELRCDRFERRGENERQAFLLAGPTGWPFDEHSIVIVIVIPLVRSLAGRSAWRTHQAQYELPFLQRAPFLQLSLERGHARHYV